MTTDADLEHLAWKFLDQCELTADQSQDEAITYRMFLSRFLAYVAREQRQSQLPRKRAHVLRFEKGVRHGRQT